MDLKTAISKALPTPLLQPVKKIYFFLFLKYFSQNQERDFSFLKNIIKQGDVVIDIGANVGIYTKRLSELVGPTGQVYSIEPVPLTFDILRFNVKKLKLQNVTLINCAISDSEGVVEVTIPSFPAGVDNFYEARIEEGRDIIAKKSIKTNSKRLDSIISAGQSKVSFIKCDVEGHEVKVIKGALRTIKNSMPVWLIETFGDSTEINSCAFQTFKLMRALGYQAFCYDGDKLNKYSQATITANYFFIKREDRREATS